MGRKNTFTPSSIQKGKEYDAIKQYITWYEEEKSYKILFDDVLVNIVGDYLVIGSFPLDMKLANSFINVGQDYGYFLTDPEYKILYVSISKTYPEFWYSYQTKKEFYENFIGLFNLYNRQSITSKYNQEIRGFIGTDAMINMDSFELQNHFIKNRFCDVLLWGSKHKDHPFRNTYTTRNITNNEHIIFNNIAMEQKKEKIYVFNVKTLFSKSQITVENHDGINIVDIKYNNTIDLPKISEINKTYQKDGLVSTLPIDCIMCIINLPFSDHINLLQMRPLKTINFVISSLVANNKEAYNDIIEYHKEHRCNIEEEYRESFDDFVAIIKNKGILLDLFQEDTFLSALNIIAKNNIKGDKAVEIIEKTLGSNIPEENRLFVKNYLAEMLFS